MNASQTTGASRIARLRASMRERGIDALICIRPESSFYLSGFNPIIHSHPVIAVLPLEREPMLLVHALRDDHARATAWVRDIRLYGAWATKVTMGPNWQDALASLLKEARVLDGTLGIEDDFLPLSRVRQLQQLAPKARFADCSGLLMASRPIKDEHEIADARIAARIADVGTEATVDALRHRVSEREVCVEAMHAMNRLWLTDYPSIEVCDFGSLEGGALGLGAHEYPSLDAKTEATLAPGMMFTFEPNLRVPEWGGLQHSDTVLITDSGAEFLTTTPNGYVQA